MRKKVDSRIQDLIQNVQKTHHRSFFVIVGDRGRDQVVTLNNLINKMESKSSKKILWCYKNKLDFSSNKNKQKKLIHKQLREGTYDNTIDDPFNVFISQNDIRYCYYRESENVLG